MSPWRGIGAAAWVLLLERVSLKGAQRVYML